MIASLLLNYEQNPRTMCRRRGAELLMQPGALPAWMLEACRFDASMDLRDLADAWASAAAA